MELAYTDCQEKAETHREQLQSSAKLDACYILGFVQKQMIKRSAEVHINMSIEGWSFYCSLKPNK